MGRVAARKGIATAPLAILHRRARRTTSVERVLEDLHGRSAERGGPGRVAGSARDAAGCRAERVMEGRKLEQLPSQ